MGHEAHTVECYLSVSSHTVDDFFHMTLAEAGDVEVTGIERPVLQLAEDV